MKFDLAIFFCDVFVFLLLYLPIFEKISHSKRLCTVANKIYGKVQIRRIQIRGLTNKINVKIDIPKLIAVQHD